MYYNLLIGNQIVAHTVNVQLMGNVNVIPNTLVNFAKPKLIYVRIKIAILKTPLDVITKGGVFVNLIGLEHNAAFFKHVWPNLIFLAVVLMGY
jgi:hypothetical protein